MSLPEPLSVEHAQERLLAGVEPLSGEVVPVERTVGRFLAKPVLAGRTQPSADLSAMDGYAMRADDVAGPWDVVGESAAGHPFDGRLARGEAIRISTGALIPSGDCVVLLQENATRTDHTLTLNGEGEPTPRHIRRAGFDFRLGDEVLTAGTRMAPAQVALALAAGHAELPVHRLPSVAVLDSGDELAADPAACAPHEIPASNGAMLAAMVAPISGSILRLGPVPDRLDAMLAALGKAADTDVIVTSGGASVGDHDLVRPALEEWGAKIDFWRVAMRPGKPLLVAKRGKQWVIGLPGNPVSSYVTAFLFLLPLLRALGGADFRHVLPLAIQAFIDEPLPPTGDRREYVRAVYANNHICPLSEQDSSGLQALARANSLILRPPNSARIEPPHAVWAYLLENGGIA